MATPTAENGAALSPPKEKVIIGNRTDGVGTTEADKLPNGGGGHQQTLDERGGGGAIGDHHFVLSQSQPSTSCTVLPLASAPNGPCQSQQTQRQCVASTRPPHEPAGLPGSPSVFINLAATVHVKGRRRRWWHWRNGAQPKGERHTTNGTGGANAAEQQQLPSVFVLDDDANGKDRRRDGYVRKWKAHAGRNRFFCDGRFMLARQSSVFLLTLFLILFTMALFCVYDIPYLTEHVSLLIPIASLLLFLFVMSTLFKTAFSDPGIVPRASPREVLEWERQCQEMDPFFNADEWAQPRTRMVNIRGQPVKLKYCFTCCIFRPPRSSHCSICDNCVLNFDHHCPWVGNCIGLRNYRHFFLFISSLSLLDAFLGLSVGIHLYLLSLEKGSFVEAVKMSPASVLTGLINIISIWSVLGLSGFHTYLIALGQTTNEDIKGTFNRKLHPQVKNPYSSGNCVKNLVATLCAPERPSLLDRRGWLPPEDKGPTIFVDGAILDQLALAAKRQLTTTTAHGTAKEANNALLTVANGRARGGDDGRKRAAGQTAPGGGDGSPSVVSTAVSSSSCPPSPPRQQRRNIGASANSADDQSQQCHRVVIPQSSIRSGRNNNDTGGGIALQQRRPMTTVPTTTTTLMAHRICHGNNLVAPMADNRNSSSDWSLASFSMAPISRGTKGRRSMTTIGSAVSKSRGDDAISSRRSPMSLVNEPRRSGANTKWRRRSGSTGEIADLGQLRGGEKGEDGQQQPPHF